MTAKQLFLVISLGNYSGIFWLRRDFICSGQDHTFCIGKVNTVEIFLFTSYIFNWGKPERDPHGRWDICAPAYVYVWTMLWIPVLESSLHHEQIQIMLQSLQNRYNYSTSWRKIIYPFDSYDKHGYYTWTFLFNGYSNGSYCMATNTVRVFSSVHAICSPMTSVMKTTCTAHQKWWWEAHAETSVKLCQGKHCGRRAASETQATQQQLALGISYTQAFICRYERLSWVHVHSHLSCWVHGVLVQYAVCMYVTLHVCLFQSVSSVPVIESYLGW